MKKLIYLFLALIIITSCGNDDEDVKHGLEFDEIPVTQAILEMNGGLWIKGMLGVHEYNAQEIIFKGGKIEYVDFQSKKVVSTYVDYMVKGDTLTYYVEFLGGRRDKYQQRITLYKVKANHENNNIISYMLGLGRLDRYTPPMSEGTYYTTW